MREVRRRVAWCCCLAFTLSACRPTTPAGEPAEPLPPISVYEITPTQDSTRVTVSRVPEATPRDPLAALGATRRVTLNASNADARTLLLWLAQEARVSLVVAPDVTSRVSVNFENVQAHDAMRAIMAEAGLSVLTTPRQPNWPPVVFYHMPVNVNEVSAEGIMERFGVSAEMAQWMVESRP
jgi:hypothetical protein